MPMVIPYAQTLISEVVTFLRRGDSVTDAERAELLGRLDQWLAHDGALGDLNRRLFEVHIAQDPAVPRSGAQGPSAFWSPERLDAVWGVLPLLVSRVGKDQLERAELRTGAGSVHIYKSQPRSAGRGGIQVEFLPL